MQLGSSEKPAPGAVEKPATGHVLIVDDNSELLDVLCEVLQTHGLSVTAVESGADALLFLEKTIPDVIVSDVMMTNMDGYELHHKVRNHPEWCQIPFIFLTALASPDEVRYGKSIGCDDYIVKPFDPQDLVSAVFGKLEAFKLRRSLSGEKLNQYRRRIIHTLSHEFRTPLVAINTGAELLLDQHNSLTEDRVENLIASIFRGGQRLQRLVEDFMTLQQIDSGSAANTCERLRRKISLIRLVNAAVESYCESHELDQPRIRLQPPVFVDNKCPNVNLYDMQIVDALHRVLNNALKFGSHDESVLVSVSKTDDGASIIVRDHGPGLPEEVMNNAREMFQQIDRETKEQQGCGLGLTIANYYTELNGGKMLFHSPKDGSGLTVELRFPLVD